MLVVYDPRNEELALRLASTSEGNHISPSDFGKKLGVSVIPEGLFSAEEVANATVTHVDDPVTGETVYFLSPGDLSRYIVENHLWIWMRDEEQYPVEIPGDIVDGSNWAVVKAYCTAVFSRCFQEDYDGKITGMRQITAIAQSITEGRPRQFVQAVNRYVTESFFQVYDDNLKDLEKMNGRWYNAVQSIRCLLKQDENPKWKQLFAAKDFAVNPLNAIDLFWQFKEYRVSNGDDYISTLGRDNITPNYVIVPKHLDEQNAKAEDLYTKFRPTVRLPDQILKSEFKRLVTREVKNFSDGVLYVLSDRRVAAWMAEHSPLIYISGLSDIAPEHKEVYEIMRIHRNRGTVGWTMEKSLENHFRNDDKFNHDRSICSGRFTLKVGDYGKIKADNQEVSDFLDWLQTDRYPQLEHSLVDTIFDAELLSIEWRNYLLKDINW